MDTTKAIGLWYDKDSDADNPMWIISLDEIDEDGGAATTSTIRTEEEYDDALAIAETHARAEGLPIYEDGKFRNVEAV